MINIWEWIKSFFDYWWVEQEEECQCKCCTESTKKAE